MQRAKYFLLDEPCGSFAFPATRIAWDLCIHVALFLKGAVPAVQILIWNMATLTDTILNIVSVFLWPVYSKISCPLCAQMV